MVNMFSRNNSAGSVQPIASRSNGPQIFAGIGGDDIDDEIGLGMMRGLAEHDDDDNRSTTSETLWDGINGPVSQQGSVPQDPEPSSNGNVDFEITPENTKEICEELLFTLASRITGYTNLQDIKREFAIDSGFIPDRIAQIYGFLNFEQFVNSDRMKCVVKVLQIGGEPVYFARDCSRFEHIRNEQMVADNAAVNKDEDEELEKLARALLPQNKEQYINGKKLILRILRDLGGQEKYVLWTSIQQRYKEETNKELAGEELRKMFQRDKALKIISSLFLKEVDVKAAGDAPNGLFYLKLLMPYDEIVRNFDTILQQQQEAVKNHQRNKRQYIPSNPSRKLTLEEKFPPTSSLFPTPPSNIPIAYEEGTSLRQTVENSAHQISNCVEDPTTNGAIKGNTLPISNSGNTTNKSKFAIPENIGAGTGKTHSSSTPPPPEPNSAKNSRKISAFDWTDGEAPPHFDGVQKENDHGSATLTNGLVDGFTRNLTTNKVKDTNNKVKTQYTTRLTNGNYTDSEDEEDIDDAMSDVTKVGAANSQQKVLQTNIERDERPSNVHQQDPQSVQRMSGAAVHQSIISNKPVGHQVNIQKHMKEMMQKGRTSSAVQSPSTERNIPAFSACRSPPHSLTPTGNGNDCGGVFQQIQNNHRVDEQPFQCDQSSNAKPFPTHGHQQQQPKVSVLCESVASAGHSQANTVTARLLPAPFDPSPSDNFVLMEHVEELRAMANRFGFSHETRYDEGSFAFRQGNSLLIFTEYNLEKVRGSWHKDGHIYKERYFQKVDWNMFSATICGLLVDARGE